jgi:hypothetical protein
VVAATAATAVALLLPLSGSALPNADPPDNSARPQITGTAAKGQTLVVDSGTWSGTVPISFAFAWQRCDTDGADCSEITGASGTTYVPVDDDVGNRLRVQVTASNTEGTEAVQSDPTSIVAGDNGPENDGEPSISGTLREGEKLTASSGTWSGAQPISYAFQWVHCPSNGGAADGSNCANISGATASTYTLVKDDVGWRIRVRVTGSNSAGSNTVASNPTSAVQPKAEARPGNTTAPSISGGMVEGTVLTANRGNWSGATPMSFTYQWLRCNASGGSCGSISGATGTQYRLTSSDVGRRVRVRVTARNNAGSTSATSGEYAVVTASGPAGVVTLPSGEKSIPATSVPSTARLIVDRVTFTPNPVRSATDPITVQVRVKDSQGYVVRDARVFVRSTPLVTSANTRQTTQTDGWITYQLIPRPGYFPQPRNGYNVQFFIKAYRNGDPSLGGVAGYRLVQVRLAR